MYYEVLTPFLLGYINDFIAPQAVTANAINENNVINKNHTTFSGASCFKNSSLNNITRAIQV